MYIPEQKGIYILIIKVSARLDLRIGKLGRFSFPTGFYTYTGSALGGLRKRITRHLRREKRKHWHIDFLVERSMVKHVIVIPTDERLECRINRFLLQREGVSIPVKEFGSSDCSCGAHLLYWGECEVRDVVNHLRKYITLPLEVIDISLP